MKAITGKRANHKRPNTPAKVRIVNRMETVRRSRNAIVPSVGRAILQPKPLTCTSGVEAHPVRGAVITYSGRVAQLQDGAEQHALQSRPPACSLKLRSRRCSVRLVRCA